MLTHLRTYILENEFRINILYNKINIVNYQEIDHFDDEKIIIRYDRGIAIIKGKNLIITKLLNDELLIEGKIRNIELQ
jgi:sporulation protein YqfC